MASIGPLQINVSMKKIFEEKSQIRLNLALHFAVGGELLFQKSLQGLSKTINKNNN